MKFEISIKEKYVLGTIPSVHSNVWARSGNKIVFFGGRADGFHGLIEVDDPFKGSAANDIAFVIDLDTFNCIATKLDPKSPFYLQMTSTNMEFCQDGDELYVVGGFGRSSLEDNVNDTTFNTMLIFSISQLISEIESKGDPGNAVKATVSDDFLQVTGGKMKFIDGYFYLMFGQNFYKEYGVGISGDYTNAIRKFKLEGTTLSEKNSLVYDYCHRRDLNVETIYGTNDLVAYGGVFTKDNNGYPNPIKILLSNGQFSCAEMQEIQQTTNQYDCAIVSVYDPDDYSNTHVLLGGIGKYQFHPSTQTWENGDLGALLPFVRSITQMNWSNNTLSQAIQLPPQSPELPELLGANAMFFPYADYWIKDNILDYSKIPTGSTPVGLFMGGILSERPTSSAIYPSALNMQIYDVLLKK